MSELQIDVNEHSTYAVVALRGEVDIYSAPRMRERLLELVTDGQRRIVIDLSEVGFLDSSGLGVIIGGLHRLRSMQGDLVLAGPPSQVQRIFEISGLTGVFQMFDDVEEAARSFT